MSYPFEALLAQRRDALVHERAVADVARLRDEHRADRDVQVAQLGVGLSFVREPVHERCARSDLEQQVWQLGVGQHRMLQRAQAQETVWLLERVELAKIDPSPGDREHRIVSTEAVLAAHVGGVELVSEVRDELLRSVGQIERASRLDFRDLPGMDRERRQRREPPQVAHVLDIASAPRSRVDHQPPHPRERQPVDPGCLRCELAQLAQPAERLNDTVGVTYLSLADARCLDQLSRRVDFAYGGVAVYG